MNLETQHVNKVVAAILSSADAFKQAAEYIDNPHIRTLCDYFSTQRNTFAEELSRAMEIKSAPSEGNEALDFESNKAAVQECLRREKKTKEMYEKALKKIVSHEIRPLLRYHVHQLELTEESLKKFQLSLKEGELEPTNR
jgi:rubrerythrin